MKGSAKFSFYFKTLLRGQQETYTPDTYGLNKKALLTISMLKVCKVMMKKSNLLFSILTVLCINIFGHLNAQTIFEFTNCGASGRYGPTQTQVNSAYSGTSLEGLVIINTQGIQEWTAPQSGTYTIEVLGASGGNYQGGYTGGKGVKMKGDFILNAGSILEIVVGQEGFPDNSNPMNISAGGGGGSYVYNSYENNALIVAGGGGGPSYKENGYDAGINNNGTTNGGSSASAGGGGGGGLVGNGGESGQAYGGNSFVNGSVGGCGYFYTSCSENQGGFGGGGGGSWASGNDGGGGGGGYNGGNGGPGGSQDTGGLGGGSYNSGANQDNSSGVNTGHGSVTITYTESNTHPTFSSTPSKFSDMLFSIASQSGRVRAVIATASPSSSAVVIV